MDAIHFMQTMKPFLKWAGRKSSILQRILANLPHGKRLIEPFAGSGAVFLGSDFNRYLLADVNEDLINLYITLQNQGEDFIDYAQNLFSQKNNKEKAYYNLRDLFNETDDLDERSAIFIYLNRHCYNGLCRYNSSGYFNVPFGRYDHPSFPQKALEDFTDKSKQAKFVCQDFKKTFISVRKGDVVYCDPPYVPLSETANFSTYAKDGFGLEDQQNLVLSAEKAVSKGIPVLISNHDTPLTRELYANAEIHSFSVARSISCKGGKRRKVKELLAIFLP